MNIQNIYTQVIIHQEMWQIKILNSYLDVLILLWNIKSRVRHMLECWRKFFSQVSPSTSSQSNLIRITHKYIWSWNYKHIFFFFWAEIIRNSSWGQFKKKKKKKASCIPPAWSCAVPEILKERRWDLNSICGKEDDEDDDDQHYHTDYDHHFNVFPPVFPGNPRGCSLERVSLKRDIIKI